MITEYNAYWHNGLIPDYMFNAKELDEENGMYYYGARYYAPPMFISRDPLFEKYPWMSPYAYTMNNPVRYIDPSGMTVEPAGEAETKAYNELKAKAPDKIRNELERLEKADEVFRIRMGDNVTSNAGDGNFGYNTTTGEFDINISKDGEYSTIEKLAHELKHGDQYLDRRIGFDLKNLGGINGDIANPIPYDRRNEYEAFDRQSLFGKTVPSQTVFNMYSKLPESKTPITIDNINMQGYNFGSIKNANSSNYGKYGQPRIMYHGWKKDIGK